MHPDVGVFRMKDFNIDTYQEKHALAFLHSPTATEKTKHHDDGTHSNQEINASIDAAVYVEFLGRERSRTQNTKLNQIAERIGYSFKGNCARLSTNLLWTGSVVMPYCSCGTGRYLAQGSSIT